MDFVELLSRPETYVSLITLAGMEIVLGIDNIVFITILCGRLPLERQHAARRIGIGLALLSRLGLLFTLSWIMGLKDPLFTILGRSISWRDLILIGGGLFLVAKSSHEIYHTVEVPPEEAGEHGAFPAKAAVASMGLIMVQIVFLDMVFSLDSVITAVGMVPHVSIMATAMVLAVIVMMIFSGPVGDFVESRPSIRILALSFLVLIGVLLFGEGLGQHLPKGYVYFAMAFSVGIEVINMRRQARARRLWLVTKAERQAVMHHGAGDQGTGWAAG
jgi:predicted tellurium resistance membrane protein TerC